MGRPVARVGDPVSYCCVLGDEIVCGVGFIDSGSSDTNANSVPVARMGDSVNCGPCGSGSVIASGTTLVNGQNIALISDTVVLPTGSGFIIGGSANTLSG